MTERLPHTPPAALLLLALLLAPGCGLLRPRPVVYEPVTLPTGVVVQDLVVPDEGPVAAEGDTVAIDYEMRLDDGSVVDSTYERGVPARFQLGAGKVPPGIEAGVVGMRLFGRRRIVVPPDQGYGVEGMPPRVPAEATLSVTVELMEVEPTPAPAEGDAGSAPAAEDDADRDG